MKLRVNEIWDLCLRDIRSKVDEKSFKTWFKPIKAIDIQANTLTIRVPNKFFYEWLENNFIEIIGLALYKHIGKGASLQYQFVVNDHKDIEGNNKNYLENKMKDNSYFKSFEAEFKNNLNPSYTFDNFISGSCNEVARNAALAISKNNGKTAFNPFIIHGGVGLGKTHLINALGNTILEVKPQCRIIFTNTERFTNQIIKSLKENTIHDFVNSFLLVDVLIIDDIQFLEDRTKTQEIFFNIFNFLHQRDKQLIFTSDRSPVELKGIQERLISRFKWGLVTELQKPDLETKIKILESKAARNELRLSTDFCNYIGSNIRTSIRDLEGVVISLSAHSRLSDKKIDKFMVEQIVKKFSEINTREISIDSIKNIVCDYFGITNKLINSDDRHRKVVNARHIAMYFSKKLTESPLKEIGSNFGNKGHSTVLHSIKTVENLMDVEPQFRDLVRNVELKLEESLDFSNV